MPRIPYIPYGINERGFLRPPPSTAHMNVRTHPSGYRHMITETLNIPEPPQSVLGMRQRQDPINKEYGMVYLLPKNFDQFTINRMPQDVKVVVKNNYVNGLQIPDQRTVLPDFNR